MSDYKTVGFIGFADNNVRTVEDFYATGLVKGVNHVGGLVGRAERGTFTNGYATGYITGTSNVGAAFGSLNNTASYVLRNNLYFDSSTSGMTTDAAGSGGTGPATGLVTADLQSALPHASWSSSTWGTGTHLYPYLKAIYGSATPQAVEGVAYLADGTTAAAGAQVGLYGNQYLLNGGTMSTGANGYFYELIANTSGGGLFADARLVINSSKSSSASEKQRSLEKVLV